MNAFRFRRAAIAVTAAAVLPLTLTACGGDDSSSDSAADKASSSAPADEKSSPAGDGAAPRTARSVRPARPSPRTVRVPSTAWPRTR